MIEPINFGGAMRRGWRLLVALAVVFAIVAVLIPVGAPAAKKGASPLHWGATAIVGAPPASGAIGTSVTTPQILFFAGTNQVKLAAIKQAKVPGNVLELQVGMTAGLAGKKGKASKSKKQTGLVQLGALAATGEEAAILVDAYSQQLGITLAAQVAAHQAANAKGSGSTTTTAPSTTTTTTAAPGTAGGTAGSTSTPTPASKTGYQVLVPAYSGKKITTKKSNLLSSRKVRLIGGFILGLVVAALILLVREVLDKTFSRPSRVEAHLKFPVVAEIPAPPRGSTSHSSPMEVVYQPTSATAEAYRKLRMSVMFEALAGAASSGTTMGGLPFGDDLFGLPSPSIEPYRAPAPGTRKVVLVLSAAEERTRPIVVANLGATYAESGQRVIVVGTGDLDLGGAGGGDVGASFDGPVSALDIQSQLRPSLLPNVSTLSLRAFVRNAGQLVSRAEAVFTAAGQVADLVLVEVPPFLTYHHGEALIHAVDVVLVVVERGATTLDDADDTGDLLRRMGAPVLGVVFTEVPMSKRAVTQLAVPQGRNPPRGEKQAPDEPTVELSPVNTQS